MITEVGMIGLGRISANMVRRLMRKGGTALAIAQQLRSEWFSSGHGFSRWGNGRTVLAGAIDSHHPVCAPYGRAMETPSICRIFPPSTLKNSAISTLDGR